MLRGFITSLLSTCILAASDTPYDYIQNGNDWGKIKGFELCDTGLEQSPIDLTNPIGTDVQKIERNGKYKDENHVINMLEKTIKVDVKNGGFKKTFQNKVQIDFTAKQFHFHAPSEHTIDGSLYDLEMHIVHATDDPSTFGVLGFMFDTQRGGEGENLFIEQLESIFNNDPGESETRKVNLAGFLDSVSMDEFWSYDGSLTTPPCSEGVKWTVFKEIQPISPAQLKRFVDLWEGKYAFSEGKGNNRAVQPLNKRKLFLAGQDVNHKRAQTALVIFGILFFLSFIGLVFACCGIMKFPEFFGLQPIKKDGDQQKDVKAKDEKSTDQKEPENRN